MPSRLTGLQAADLAQKNTYFLLLHIQKVYHSCMSSTEDKEAAELQDGWDSQY
jgi:hypothetical protein